MRRWIAVVLTLACLAAGAAAILLGAREVGRLIWLVGLVVLGAPLVFATARDALRGHFATDVVATLSIIGAVALDQPLAGLVIVLMQTGGEALERYAEGRASAAVAALEAAAPQVAHRISADGVHDVPAHTVAAGDRLLVRPGDLVPCDGVIERGESELDTSRLTGEPAPMRATTGTRVMSGMLNGFGSFEMRASARAANSQYARIVELVRRAQASKAPLQRLADRFAVWFTPITLVVCGIVVLVTRDWLRALSVLVVATPCPLLLAAPVAIVGGINRAARRFVIVRNGVALERLSAVNAAVFDKTGTLTIGQPRLAAVHVTAEHPRDEVLRYAAAVEEHASHLLARVLVAATRHEGLAIPTSSGHVETPGLGIAGTVDGHAVVVGARRFVLSHTTDGGASAGALDMPGEGMRAFVAIDGVLAAVIEFADEIRSELPSVIASLGALGIRRLTLLSGDQTRIAQRIAAHLGIPEAHGDLLAGDKARYIDRMRDEGAVVMMVGDGINDAPALTAADVGVALAAHGGGITAEAADVVVLIDQLDRVPEAIAIARRTMHIARQSIWIGLGLSGAAMLVAAFGRLPPAIGAALQEGIDIAVIVNALRTAFAPRG